MDRKPLLVSFSGGRTSAYMAQKILNDEEVLAEYEPHLVFANTGLEHEKTLQFIHDFEQHFRQPVVWLEAVIQPEKGQGTRHKRVDFETAARKGEPFREMVAKYTLPNVRFRHCTRELKLSAINSWARECFGTSRIDTAVGIRIDEMRRVSGKQDRKIVYPLIDWYPTDKADVLAHWAQMPFDLGLPEYLGNCIPCFQKSDTKLLKAMQEMPEYFEILEQIERDYPNGRNGEPVHFFRHNRDVAHFRGLLAEIGQVPEQIGLLGGGCGESCEFLGAFDE